MHACKDLKYVILPKLCLDVFPESITFDYEEVGDVVVYVELSNIVSRTALKYQFTLIEKIEGLKLDVVSSFSGLLNLEDADAAVDAAEDEDLIFVVTVTAGSHVEYTIDYGDGNFDTESPLTLHAKNSVLKFTHYYEKYGIYDVNITAKNAIHPMSRFYETSVRVYETVDSISTSVKTVDYNQDLYGGSIFDQSSEVFALLFGIPASIK